MLNNIGIISPKYCPNYSLQASAVAAITLMAFSLTKEIELEKNPTESYTNSYEN